MQTYRSTAVKARLLGIPICAGLCIALVSASHALPANPQRPLAAQTCDAALARLAEAQIGSPLVPASSHAQLLRIAQADVVRLCDAGHVNRRDSVPPQ